MPDIPEPPKPGNLTQERLVERASNEAADILAKVVNEMFAVKESGDWSKVFRLLGQLASLDGDTRIAGAILGMISPWLPNLRDVPRGTPRSVRAIQMAVKGLDDILPEGVGEQYRWPTLEDSIKWIVDEKVAGRDALQSLHRDMRRRAFSESVQGSQKLLTRLQDALAESMTAGDSVAEFRTRIKDVTEVSRSEAETILRTNTKQAYLYGQERTLDQPGVKDRFRWVYYASTKDNRVRPHHWALDGWVAERGTPLHRVFLKVQSEFNCRCTVIPCDQRRADEFGVKTESDLPSALRSYL